MKAEGRGRKKNMKWKAEKTENRRTREIKGEREKGIKVSGRRVEEPSKQVG